MVRQGCWTGKGCSHLALDAGSLLPSVASSGVDGEAETVGDVVVSGACSGQTGDGGLSATGAVGIVAPSTRRVGAARLARRGRSPPNRGSLAERIRARRVWTACTDGIEAPPSTPDSLCLTPIKQRSGDPESSCQAGLRVAGQGDFCSGDMDLRTRTRACCELWTPDLCSLRSRRPALTGETGADVGGTFGSRYLMLTLNGVLDASGAAFLCRRRARPEHVVRHVPE